jgi:three-Cys-motif partner protein
MTANHYDWQWGGSLPKLLRHSQVKHALLRAYLVDYFLTLVSSPHQDKIQLTVVDGFCGGGRYVNEAGQDVPGSPVVILQAVQEAKARVLHEQQRRKPLEFDVKLICIDESAAAIEHLKRVLNEQGFGDKLRDGSVQLLQGDFVAHADAAIAEAQRRSPKAGRAIFVLDQYGYDSVPLRSLKQIFSTLNRPEVILTFNVDSLINYLCEKNVNDFERKTGITGAIPAAQLDRDHRSPNWRLEVQAGLYQRLTMGSGASYFTPFFIRPERGHGDFWLLHLSQHWKARDVMANAHWKHQNHFVHYGAAGFDMLSTGYAARIDAATKPQAAFEFDDIASAASLEALMAQIPRALDNHRGGIAFDQFFLDRMNTTPATKEMVEAAVLKLAVEKELQVLGKSGATSKVRVALKPSHILRLPPQRGFSF